MSNTPPTATTRRDALKLAAAATAAAWSPLPVAADEVRPAARDRRRVLRLAHLTDIHVQPERAAAQGLAACLRRVHGLKDRPELILTGGDGVMDAFAVGIDRARVQADVWRRVWRDECSLPVEHCIGNHDVWGWDRKRSGARGDEASWGKAWATELYGLANRYRSFDRAGWHFVVLDSTHPADKGGYTAKLDAEQFDWLARDLAGVPAATPVLVLSHIPILSVAAFMDGENEKSGDWRVPGAWMHVDARRIKDVFKRHPNVKLCLSGHLHLTDRCEYAGVTYVCGGAVCGNWWKGAYQEAREGYGIIDLYADGAFDVQYVPFGWKAVPEKG